MDYEAQKTGSWHCSIPSQGLEWGGWYVLDPGSIKTEQFKSCIFQGIFDFYSHHSSPRWQYGGRRNRFRWEEGWKDHGLSPLGPIGYGCIRTTIGFVLQSLNELWDKRKEAPETGWWEFREPTTKILYESVQGWGFSIWREIRQAQRLPCSRLFQGHGGIFAGKQIIGYENVGKDPVDVAAVRATDASYWDGESTTRQLNGAGDTTMTVKIMTAKRADEELFTGAEGLEKQVIDPLQHLLTWDIGKWSYLIQAFVFRGHKLLENPCDYL